METAIKERPILFSTSMVQAILEGRKTMTRRVIKPQFEFDANSQTIEKSNQWKKYDWVVKHQVVFEPEYERYEVDTLLKCPYGKPGDILWVRETWTNDPRGSANQEDDCIYYKADMPDPKIWEGFWKPSIFMKKEYCRIFLEITDVRVERIQDISQEDSQAEGVFQAPHRPASEGCTQHADKSISRDCFKCTFKSLWNRINGPLGHQWDKNEWVWVVNFKRIEK